MLERHVARTARELALAPAQVRATAGLLAEGATVPFIARYRKEATGSLDEVAIAAVRDRLAQLDALDQRRRAITASLQERDLLTDALRSGLDAAETLALFWERGLLRSELRDGKAAAGVKFKDYFAWSEPIANAPAHRVLAILRGEGEGVLSCSIEPPEQDALAALERRFVTGRGAGSEQVRLAVRDGYRRLLGRAMETETRAEAKRRADTAAIAV